MKYTGNDRTIKLIKILTQSNNYRTVYDLSVELSVSQRTVYSTLNEIRSILLKGKLSDSITEYNKGVLLSKDQKKYLLHYVEISLNESLTVYSLTQEERVAIIFCEVFCGSNFVNIHDFEEMFFVSRKTINNDMNYLKSQLKELNLSIKYDKKKSFYIVGDQFVARKTFYYYFSLIYDALKKIPEIVEKSSFLDGKTFSVYNIFQKINLKNDYYNVSLLALSCITKCIMTKKANIISENSLQKNVDFEYSSEKKFVEKHFVKIPEIEKRYITTYLYCSSTSLFKPNLDRNQIVSIVNKMNDEISSFSEISFDDPEFNEIIANHLELAYYRYIYGILIDNPLISEIKEKYPFFYLMAKKSTSVIEKEFNIKLNDNEIGYFALYYAGFSRRKNESKLNIDCIIVCDGASAQSYLMANEIKRLDSRINIVEILTSTEYIANHNNYSNVLVISCVKLKKFYHSNVILCDSILSNLNKIEISNYLNNISLDDMYRYSKLKTLNLVRKVVKDKDYKQVLLEMSEKYKNESYVKSKGIEHYFKQKFVQIETKGEDKWEDMVYIACEPLIKENYIDYNYYKHVIEKIYKHGDYMFYKNGYLIGHADKEYSNNLGISFLKCSKKVDILGHLVDKIFIITPTNNKDHLFFINALSSLCNNDKLNNDINNSNDIYEIYVILLSQLLYNLN